MMKTIQITLDETLLRHIDKQCGQRGRSHFFREAAQLMLKQQQIRKLEAQHRAGYLRQPVKSGEFDIWHDEQAWAE